MSKLSIQLSYKNACILKHALRNQIEDKKQWIQANSDGIENREEERIELEEEIKALDAITQQIDAAVGSWRQK